jgi:hypothetical protein
MSDFTVKLYQPTYKKLWDDFVTKAKNSTFLFYRDFMEYHQDRFEDYSLLVFKGEKLMALLPANRVDTIVHSHQGLTYGGLILNKDIKLFDVSEAFKELLKFLHSNKIKQFFLKQLPSIYCDLPSDEMQYLMFILEAKLFRCDSLSVLLLQNKPKVSKDRIAGNKRADKYSLVIREVNEFDEFWNIILIPNLNTKHQVQPVHSLDEIKFLKSKFQKQIRQFNIYMNDEIVAGTTIFETKHVAHSQYISGNQNKNILGSLDYLHMHLIENVYKNKKYFDFGISNESQGKQINEGLSYWKEGFGARTITQDFYEIDISNHNLLDNIWI